VPRLTVRPARGFPRRWDRDRGASATLVAVLLAGGVLLGMTALVVDVGKIYAEREELMSGADAAAMAVARDCALNRPACEPTTVVATAGGYANQNARDGTSAVAYVCGHDPEGRLRPCDTGPVGNLTDCLGERPTDGTAYVEVRTTTRLPDGSTLLPPSFAQALVSGYDGTTVGACSRVAWGSPSSGLAYTISTCEWDEATNGGTDFAPPPPAVPDVRYERVIYTHQSQKALTCPAGPAGWDAPGGFGRLDDGVPEDCQSPIAGDEYLGSDGNNFPAACANALWSARANRTVLLVPVFDGSMRVGGEIRYHLAGFAAFVLTGYFMSPGGNPNAPGNAVSTLTGQHYCSGQERCLYGYFTAALVPGEGEIGPLPSLGAVVVRTIG
jgi:hypothetical protein